MEANKRLLDAVLWNLTDVEADVEAAVKDALNEGADVNYRSDNGKTVLMWAAKYGVTEGVKLLLAAGADVNAKDNYGDTALVCAVRRGYKEVVRELLANGADVNAGKRTSTDGMNDFIFAARMGYTEIVELLLAKGADVNAKSTASQGGLVIASDEKYVERSLLNGYDPNYDGCDDTALILAAKMGHKATVDVLLAKDANVNAKNTFGYTALTSAAKNGHADIVDLLKAYGADIPWRQRHGNKLLGAGVVGVGLIFGLGYVLPAFSFSMKLTVSIASACTVLLLAYGIDHSAQAAYKAEVLAKHKGQHVSSGDMAASANAAPVSGMGNAADETVQLGDSDTDAKKPGEKKP